MTIDHSDKFHVLSSDVGLNAHETSETLSSFAMSTRMGLWGSSMFGDIYILGAGMVNTYLSNVERNILVTDVSQNVERLPVILHISVMSTRTGMWGEVMFGSEDILGTGSLNMSYG